MENTIYTKLQSIKLELSQANLKKSGKNTFSGFAYFELSDFLPTLISLCDKYKVCTYVSFSNDLATLTAINSETPTEIVSVTSPMRNIEMKGANEIQMLGAIQTYMRRYLYMSMFDIVENDAFDATSGKTESTQQAAQNHQQQRFTNQQPQQQQQQKQYQDEIVDLDFNGATVSYKKCYNKAKAQFFWVITDESLLSTGAKKFISDTEMNSILGQ